MKVVFICSPFQGKQGDVEKAKRYCRAVVDMGYIPIAPHVYFSQFIDDQNQEDRKRALEMNKKLSYSVYSDRRGGGISATVPSSNRMVE